MTIISLHYLLFFLFTIEKGYSQTWRTILKINNGVSFDEGSAAVWYNSGAATYDSLSAEESYLTWVKTAGNTYSTQSINFKSLLIEQWDSLNVQEVRISICDSNTVQKQITFDASSSTSSDWLSVSKITSSDWTDLESSTSVSSTYQGITTTWQYRNFAIWYHASECNVDALWFAVSTWGFCDSSRNGWNEDQGTIFYSPLSTEATMVDNGAIADAMIVEIMYSPTVIPTASPTGIPTVIPSQIPTLFPSTNPTAEPTTEPTFEPTFEPTNEPTFKPTMDPTTEPTFEPTLIPSSEPTTIPTPRPTTGLNVIHDTKSMLNFKYFFFPISTECAGEEDVIFIISFEYTLEDEDATESEISDTLNDAVSIFIEDEFGESSELTDCLLTDYDPVIVLDGELTSARINASMCFLCDTDETLEIDISDADLESDFIDTVEQTTSILVVQDVNQLTVNVLEEREAQESTSTPSSTLISVQNMDEMRSLLDDPLLIPFLCGSIAAVCCFVFGVVIVLRRRRRTKRLKNDDTVARDLRGAQLAQMQAMQRIVSASYPIPNITNLNSNGLNEIHPESPNEDLYIPENSGMVNVNSLDSNATAGGIITLGGEVATDSDSCKVLENWLKEIRLEGYYAMFVSHGFDDDLTKLKELNQSEMIKMGIAKVAHRKALLMRIRVDPIVQMRGSSEDEDDNELYDGNRRRSNAESEYVTPSMTPMRGGPLNDSTTKSGNVLTLNGFDADEQPPCALPCDTKGTRKHADDENETENLYGLRQSGTTKRAGAVTDHGDI